MAGFRLVACCVLLAAVGLHAKNVKGGCAISLNSHLPKKNEPVFFVRGSNKALTLAMPTSEGKEGTLSLTTGQEVVVACPGNKNQLVASKEEFTSAVCRSGNTLSMKGKDIKTDKLDCSNRVAADLEITKNPCAGGKGLVIEQGFKVEKWHTLVESCHSLDMAHTFYSVHTVYGTSLSGKVIQSARPGFSRGHKDLYKGFNPDKAFSQKNQEEVFTRDLGAKKAAEYLQPKKGFFLARGHLAPDADFLFGAWQMLTYFYINTAPQWQSINAGNWLGVENNVRKLATSLEADLQVITGTHGIMSLPNASGKQVPIYLEGKDRLPVPELYWKIVRNPNTNACMAVVSTNNPFLDKPPTPLCTDICAAHNWPLYQSELSKGYVYCCEANEFIKAVGPVPAVQCDSVLKFE